jgi:NTE family protein
VSATEKGAALVLGGGGLTGIAWEAGVLFGLEDAGLGVDTWRRVVGTSAGAVVGARALGDGSARELFEEQLRRDVERDEAELGSLLGAWSLGAVRLARRPGLAWVGTAAVAPMLVRSLVLGERASGRGLRDLPRDLLPTRRARPDRTMLAILARGSGPTEASWLAFWERHLGASRAWPSTPLIVTAVDARDGARVFLDAAGGTPLLRAIAATTALPGLLAPVDVDGRPCVDGGARTSTNADVVAGVAAALVLAPVDRGALAGELRVLAASGTRAAVLRPGRAARSALGRNLGRLDPSRVAAAAETGAADGRAAARRVAELLADARA